MNVKVGLESFSQGGAERVGERDFGDRSLPPFCTTVAPLHLRFGLVRPQILSRMERRKQRNGKVQDAQNGLGWLKGSSRCHASIATPRRRSRLSPQLAGARMAN